MKNKTIKIFAIIALVLFIFMSFTSVTMATRRPGKPEGLEGKWERVRFIHIYPSGWVHIIVYWQWIGEGDGVIAHVILEDYWIEPEMGPPAPTH